MHLQGRGGRDPRRDAERNSREGRLLLQSILAGNAALLGFAGLMHSGGGRPFPLFSSSPDHWGIPLLVGGVLVAGFSLAAAVTRAERPYRRFRVPAILAGAACVALGLWRLERPGEAAGDGVWADVLIMLLGAAVIVFQGWILPMKEAEAALAEEEREEAGRGLSGVPGPGPGAPPSG